MPIWIELRDYEFADASDHDESNRHDKNRKCIGFIIARI